MSNAIKGLKPTKRQFVGGAAAGVALAAGGLRSAEAAGSYNAEYEIDPKTMFDIIVIGAGNAGMPLAIQASQRGAKVLLIEKSAQIGGTLYFSGGTFSAAPTKLQARKGIKDTTDAFYDDVMRLTHNTADPAVLRRWVDTSGPSADWLEDIGMKYAPTQPITGSAHANFKVARYQGPIGNGRAFVTVMLPELLKQEQTGNLRVLMTSAAKTLTKDAKGAVTGVVVEDMNTGKLTTFKARNTVLASGGCLMNKTLFEKYNKKPLYGRRVYPFSNGDGLVMGEAAGGVVTGADRFIAHRGVIMSDRNYPSPQFASITAMVDPRYRQPWEIEVNREGKRYMAEDNDLDTLERAQTSQTGMSSIYIWDQEIYDKAPPLFTSISKDQLAQAFDIHPMFAKADSIRALAKKMNLPGPTLEKTIAEYNAGVAAKTDKFGRKHMPLPIAKGPFYAVETLGSGVFGHTGLNIDGDLRVLDRTNKPIPHLYAIGEVTGGWHCHGNVVVNGATVGPAISFGYYLGQTLPIGA